MATKRFAFFPGCSADSTGASFTRSMDYVCKVIGLALMEIPDWCCCGTSAAKVTNEDLALALPARSMALAEAALPDMDVVAHCAGCFASLKSAVSYARSGQKELEHIRELIQLPYEAKADVFSILEVLSRPAMSLRIAAGIAEKGRRLNDIKIACYHGCALVRPPKIANFDDPENPQSMDALLRLTGATTIDWAFKTECCGASHHITTPKTAQRLTERIFANARSAGADAIATACPLCMLNLDMREKEINASRQTRGEEPFDMPVYYFTELLGLALGASPKTLGIDNHFWPAQKLAKEALTSKTSQADKSPQASKTSQADKASQADKSSQASKTSQADKSSQASKTSQAGNATNTPQPSRTEVAK